MGTRKVIDVQIPVIVLYRCHPRGQCNFFECFLSVGFSFPKAPPKEKHAQLFLNSLNFQCLSPVVGTPQVTPDRRTLEFFPGKEHTVSSFKRSHVVTGSFVSLSEDGEVYLEGRKMGRRWSFWRDLNPKSAIS